MKLSFHYLKFLSQIFQVQLKYDALNSLKWLCITFYQEFVIESI